MIFLLDQVRVSGPTHTDCIAGVDLVETPPRATATSGDKEPTLKNKKTNGTLTCSPLTGPCILRRPPSSIIRTIFHRKKDQVCGLNITTCIIYVIIIVRPNTG